MLKRFPLPLLDATGLVFNDPVETGWSRPAPRPSEAPAGGGSAR